MFRLASGLGMRFIANDPYVNPRLNTDLDVEIVKLDKLFREADILCVNCDLNKNSEKLVGARLLSLMKPTAFLINTARGPIVVQQDLTQALQQGEIAGAGLDVLEKEPPNADDPLLSMDNVILTPHALAWTDQLFASIGRSVNESVLAVKRGTIPENTVNREVLQTSRFQEKMERYRLQSSQNS